MQDRRRNRRQRKKRNFLGMVAIALGVGLVMFAAVYFTAASKSANAEPGNSLAGVKVVIDPGHGGFDGGSVGVTGTVEAEINLEISKLLQKELEAEGAEVLMLRETDEAVADEKQKDMEKRRELIETSGQDVTVSIHQNRFDDPDVCGPQVFYAPGSVEGEKLAGCVQESMNEALEVEKPRKQMEGNYYIVKSGAAPAVIVECGFLSNPEEEAKLKDKKYQKEIAKAVREGIAAYLQEETGAQGI